jgi:alpha-L-fucosidase
MRNKEFHDEWYGKIIEVIDNYSPDFIWFDFALDDIAEGYVKDFLAYYYNHAEKEGKEVVVTYKGHDIIPGAGVRDLELGQEPEITYHDWITDTSVDDRGAWGWAEDLTFKSANRLIDNLVDRVSKNGYLLLNVGPKPDGTIPEGARKVLLEMGEWLNTNGEAIYGTTPWFISGEGPVNLGEASDIGFNESDVVYTPRDIRFTVKGDNLYATFLAWPGDVALIETLRSSRPGAGNQEVPEWAIPKTQKSLAGTEWEVWFEQEGWEGDVDFEFVNEKEFKFKKEDEIRSGTYEQLGNLVYLYLNGEKETAFYDGEEFSWEDFRDRYRPFYPEEVKKITMLGDGEELEWVMTEHGLAIKTPEKKGDNAYVFKIERYHRPPFK